MRRAKPPPLVRRSQWSEHACARAAALHLCPPSAAAAAAAVAAAEAEAEAEAVEKERQKLGRQLQQKKRWW